MRQSAETKGGGPSPKPEAHGGISGAKGGQGQQPTDVKSPPSNILFSTSGSMSINNDGQR